MEVTLLPFVSEGYVFLVHEAQCIITVNLYELYRFLCAYIYIFKISLCVLTSVNISSSFCVPLKHLFDFHSYGFFSVIHTGFRIFWYVFRWSERWLLSDLLRRHNVFIRD